MLGKILEEMHIPPIKRIFTDWQAKAAGIKRKSLNAKAIRIAWLNGRKSLGL